MTAAPVVPDTIDFTDLRKRVDDLLESFFDDKAGLAATRRLPGEVTALLRDFVLSGGKRLRPLLCTVGWSAAAPDTPPPDFVVRAAASLELFHAFALIHDDVMDGTHLRRGSPTVHRAFADHHAPRRDAVRLGEHCAILAGDLAHVWSDELLSTASPPPGAVPAVHRVMDLMRWEVMFGQYLDLLASGPPGPEFETDAAEERALQIIRYKTARYTVEHPLHLGAALAEADPPVYAALSAYALPIGEAFQLRDDLLGTFGDPATTGKPSLDDLREGKGTLLLALAMRSADAAQRDTLRRLIGRPDLTERDARLVRSVLDDTGAHAAVETLILARLDQACQALEQADLPPAATAALRTLASASTRRNT